MKRTLSAILLIILSFVTFQTRALAHLAGQPPYFVVNGVYSNLYPVPSTSLEDFNLPQDLADGKFLVGQKINFELDVNKLPVTPGVVGQTKFTWDFGDGEHVTGLKNSHVYQKPGSYILSIDAQYITDPTPQLLESVLINVLPDANYKLPQSIIKVNGWISKDPLTDILKLKFGNTVHLDGSSSKVGTAKIVSYFWDYGDRKSAPGIKLDHTYDTNLGQVFPLLRVKDENGFFSDSFVEIENRDVPDNVPNAAVSPTINQTKKTQNQPFDYKIIILIVAGIIILFIVLLIFKKKK